VNETGDNLYDHHRENPFSMLESPPMRFTDGPAHNPASVDEGSLELDAPSVARVGPDELVRIGAVPVRWEDGSLRIVVTETTSERIAAVREHFSSEVALSVVTAGTLDRLLDAVRSSAVAEPAGADGLGTSFERVLNLFDEEAGRFQALRRKLQQVGHQIGERDQRLQELDAEVHRLRVERQHDQLTIERLRSDLAEREGRLERATATMEELAAIIRGSATL
jgi:hypothetical protein